MTRYPSAASATIRARSRSGGKAEPLSTEPIACASTSETRPESWPTFGHA